MRYRPSSQRHNRAIPSPGILFSLVLLSGAVAACSALSASPSAAQTPNLTPTASPASTSTSVTFRLSLKSQPDDTQSFGLVIDSDPPNFGQTGFAFCGSSPYDPKTCGAPGTFDRKFGGLAPATVLVYQFVRYAKSGDKEVFAQGRIVPDGSVLEVTYPPN